MLVLRGFLDSDRILGLEAWLAWSRVKGWDRFMVNFTRFRQFLRDLCQCIRVAGRVELVEFMKGFEMDCDCMVENTFYSCNMAAFVYMSYLGTVLWFKIESRGSQTFLWPSRLYSFHIV